MTDYIKLAVAFTLVAVVIFALYWKPKGPR